MIDDTSVLRFFIEPSTPAQRQYEALRAFFMERTSQQDIADRFGYTINTVRNMVYEFRHGRLSPFFKTERLAAIPRNLKTETRG
ncbi:MAG: hypothetical protein N2C14_03955 [Planctomycetales bacterium]